MVLSTPYLQIMCTNKIIADLLACDYFSTIVLSRLYLSKQVP